MTFTMSTAVDRDVGAVKQRKQRQKAVLAGVFVIGPLLETYVLSLRAFASAASLARLAYYIFLFFCVFVEVVIIGVFIQQGCQFVVPIRQYLRQASAAPTRALPSSPSTPRSASISPASSSSPPPSGSTAAEGNDAASLGTEAPSIDLSSGGSSYDKTSETSLLLGRVTFWLVMTAASTFGFILSLVGLSLVLVLQIEGTWAYEVMIVSAVTFRIMMSFTKVRARLDVPLYTFRVYVSTPHLLVFPLPRSPPFALVRQVQSLSSSSNAAAQAAGTFTAAVRSACLWLSCRQTVARVRPVLAGLNGAANLGVSSTLNNESLIMQIIRAAFGTVATSYSESSASYNSPSEAPEEEESKEEESKEDESEDQFPPPMHWEESYDETTASRSVSMIILNTTTLPRPHHSDGERMASSPLQDTSRSLVASGSTPDMRPRDRSDGGITCSSLTEGSPHPSSRYREADGASYTDLQAAAEATELETQRDAGISESDTPSAGDMSGLGGTFGAAQQGQGVAAQHHVIDDQARQAALQQLPRSWFNSVSDGRQDPTSAVHRYERRGRSGNSVSSSSTGFSLPSALVRFTARREGEARRLPAWHMRKRALVSKLLAFGTFAQLRRELEVRRALCEVVNARNEVTWREGNGAMSIDEHVLAVVESYINRLATPLSPAERLEVSRQRLELQARHERDRTRSMDLVMDERRRGLHQVDDEWTLGGHSGWGSDTFGEGLLM